MYIYIYYMYISMCVPHIKNISLECTTRSCSTSAWGRCAGRPTRGTGSRAWSSIGGCVGVVNFAFYVFGGLGVCLHPNPQKSGPTKTCTDLARTPCIFMYIGHRDEQAGGDDPGGPLPRLRHAVRRTRSLLYLFTHTYIYVCVILRVYTYG